MAEAKKTARQKTDASKLKKDIKKTELVAETTPVDQVPEVKIQEEAIPQSAAKTGKRSAKSARESEQKQAKEVRKTQVQSTEDTKKPEVKNQPKKNRQERAGKKYRAMAGQIDKTKTYTLQEALGLVIKTSPTKFDGTIEMHLNLNVDPRQADQNVRDTVVLPSGTGKKVRIAVFTDGEESAKALKAGADIAGEEEIAAKLDKEDIDFDVLIATPAMMPKLGKYARLLGPRGLMPNPKSGTVTSDVAEATMQAKAGKVEYRVDEAGIVHLAIGKASFGADKLQLNADAVLGSIRAARPSNLKGGYIKSVYLTSTMGPSIKTDVSA